jgi:putative acetyltransferase
VAVPIPKPLDDIELRRAREEDLKKLAHLYAEAVTELGPEHYVQEIVEAWASFAGRPGFESLVLDHETWVAVDGQEIVGFGGIGDAGYVASLYVAPSHGRQGIGARILGRLMERGRGRGNEVFHTEASELSRGLFERFGFVVVEQEVVERDGIQIVRHKMEARPRRSHGQGRPE